MRNRDLVASFLFDRAADTDADAIRRKRWNDLTRGTNWRIDRFAGGKLGAFPFERDDLLINQRHGHIDFHDASSELHRTAESSINA